MNLKIRQINRPIEEREKTIELLKRIEEHHSDNEPLIHAVNNSLFRHILATIELLRPDLKFTTEPFHYKKDKPYMTDMVRYELNLSKGRRRSVVWVYFPSGRSEYNMVQCRLQNFRYTSTKIEQARPTDNHGYPTLKVHDFSDIVELIGCLNEALPNIHRK
jgi:hypothetical protein